MVGPRAFSMDQARKSGTARKSQTGAHTNQQVATECPCAWDAIPGRAMKWAGGRGHCWGLGPRQVLGRARGLCLQNVHSACTWLRVGPANHHLPEAQTRASTSPRSGGTVFDPSPWVAPVFMTTEGTLKQKSLCSSAKGSFHKLSYDHRNLRKPELGSKDLSSDY